MVSPPGVSDRKTFQVLRSGLAVLVFFLIMVTGSEAAAAEPDYGRVIRNLRRLAGEEVARGRLTGVSVALVDEGGVVYAEGFGVADRETRRPATGKTIYRVGSISKLFTAVAAMQLVEAGRLDLDTPVTRLNPDFRIVNPYLEADPSRPVTLRQLMCHRSGFVREAPVGSYFDPTEPGLAATVRSLEPCVLVHAPGSRTKYSNSGVTVVGDTVARAAGLDFAEYQRRFILEPLGLKDSDFLPDRVEADRRAKGYLEVAQVGGGFVSETAPDFVLGTIPAGNLYSTVEDLGRFMTSLFRGGRLEGGRGLLKEASLKEMFTPQLTGEKDGFGLGFHVGRFAGRKIVSHSGAVYGFTSSFIALIEEQLGVIVLANDDLVTGPVRRLTDAGLEGLMEVRQGLDPPLHPEPMPIGEAEAADFEGQFESESYWAEVAWSEGGLRANLSGQPLVMHREGKDRFQAQGRVAQRALFEFQREDGRVTGIRAWGQDFKRVPEGRREGMPSAWRELLGSYGPAFIPLIIAERHGHLYAMTENMFDYRLHPVNASTFAMPPGMYEEEHLTFHRDAKGRVYGLTLANMPMKRRK